MVSKVKAKPATGKKRNPFYTILYIPNAEYITTREYGDFDYKKYKYKTIMEHLAIFKTEEAAYKHLFEEHFTKWMSRERNLQILLLVSELSKNDPDIAYKIFLDEDKSLKVFNHVTLIGYLKRNNMFKAAFKALCDVVVIRGLGRDATRKVCFEHYEVEQHSPNTDVSTLFVPQQVKDDL